jgi:hypothetical protein
MSDIAKLYEEVMADSEIEKTASDVSGQAVAFDHDFFEKVASGDPEASEELNEFVEAARSEGYDDDDIEQAIAMTMEENGFDPEAMGTGESDFEMQKAASYQEGSLKAIEDVLEKAAEWGVDEDEILDFYLGASYGEGYAETRQNLEDAVEKIAMAKEAGPRSQKAMELAKMLAGDVAGGARYAGGKAWGGAKYVGGKAKAGAKRGGSLVTGSKKTKGVGAFTSKKKRYGMGMSEEAFKKARNEARKVFGTRAALATGAGAGGAEAYRRNK